MNILLFPGILSIVRYAIYDDAVCTLHILDKAISLGEGPAVERLVQYVSFVSKCKVGVPRI